MGVGPIPTAWLKWAGCVLVYLPCVLVLNLGTDVGMQGKVGAKVLKVLCGGQEGSSGYRLMLASTSAQIEQGWIV